MVAQVINKILFVRLKWVSHRLSFKGGRPIRSGGSPDILQVHSPENHVKRLAIALLSVALGAPSLWAQGVLDSQEVKNWAWDQVKAWHYQARDAQGHPLWTNRTFFSLSQEEQTSELLEKLSGGPLERRAALVVLGSRPMEAWAPRALARTAARDEVALWLFRHGYKAGNADPYVYLDPAVTIA